MAMLIGCISAGSFLTGLLAIRTKTAPAVAAVLSAQRETRAGSIGVMSTLGRTRFAHWFKATDRLRRRLELAGHPMPVETLLGLKVAMAGVSACLLGTLAVRAPMLLLIVPMGVIASSRFPDLVLARRAKRRQAAIGVQGPDLVELLVATTEAGLSPSLAFRRSAEALSGPLGSELQETVRRVELGTPWRIALQSMVERTEVPPLRRLVGALSRSQRLGASLGAMLRSVADDLRGERRARAEETARRAPIKMLFPLVFLILPAFLLLTVGPVLVATLRSLH